MFKRRKRRKQKGAPTAELTPDQYQAMIEQAEELQRAGDLQKALGLFRPIRRGSKPYHSVAFVFLHQNPVIHS